jgi:hypothetical protein
VPIRGGGGGRRYKNRGFGRGTGGTGRGAGVVQPTIPLTPAEEAEIQKGTNKSPSAGNGKEEKEEKEEKKRGKDEWKEKKATNLWDKVDVLALRAIL